MRITSDWPYEMKGKPAMPVAAPASAPLRTVRRETPLRAFMSFSSVEIVFRQYNRAAPGVLGYDGRMSSIATAPPAVAASSYIEVRRHELRKARMVMVDGNLVSNARSVEAGA